MYSLVSKRNKKFLDRPLCKEQWDNLKGDEKDHPLHTCIGHTCNTRHHCSCGAGKEVKSRYRKDRIRFYGKTN